jgi:CRISPR-associated Csx10 family RAMP protein
VKRHRMRAELVSPVVARKERQSQRSEGVTSLSGTLVRGALARIYLDQHGEPDERFRRLFLDEEKCRYGPLDPAEHAFPLSAASCKREPGFVADGRHGLADLLWLRIARRMLGRELPEEFRLRGLRCGFPGCGQDLKAKDGFWTRREEKPAEAKGRWRRRTDTHVGIDRYTNSAYESILYTLPVLESRGEGTELTGLLEAGDEEAAELRTLLDAEDFEVSIGHARTRGYGRVKLYLDEVPQAGGGDLEAWSRGLIDFLRAAAPGLEALDPARHFFFSLGLPNGALLLDEVLRFTLDPSGMVPWLPPLPPPHPSRPARDNGSQAFAGGRLWCVAAITRHERLRGWNAAHGLPRQDEWIVSRGAVYAYLFEGGEADQQKLRERLSELGESGLGARRNEGLGRVNVSDEFHQLFHRQETRP